MAFEFTDDNFQSAALETDALVVADFWAVWCGPCKMIAPIIDEAASEYNGEVVIGKVDVDNNPQVASKYSIRSIPTILFIKNGEVVDKHVGVISKQALKEKIEANK
ncbi:MAG: thioredoxin [Saprospirales bacterium]|nr:MAG: thioredoxin [Saprospirales bacterium]